MSSFKNDTGGDFMIVMVFIALLMIISFFWLVLNAPMEPVLNDVHDSPYIESQTKDFIIMWWVRGALIVTFIGACLAFLVWFIRERG